MILPFIPYVISKLFKKKDPSFFSQAINNNKTYSSGDIKANAFSNAIASDSLTDAGIATGIENQLTGNLDYQRQLDVLSKEQSFNAMEAQKSRDWSEYMSNTSYQREAADLAAAGFNPALALGTGGASGYSAAVASSGSSSPQSSGNGFALLGKLLGAIVQQSSMNARAADYIQSRQEIANDRLDLMVQKLDSQNAKDDAVQALNVAKLQHRINNDSVRNAQRDDQYRADIHRNKYSNFLDASRTQYYNDIHDAYMARMREGRY